MQSIFDQYSSDLIDPITGKQHRKLAQGYVSMLVYEAATGKKLFRNVGFNTIVNDARMSAASAFAGLPITTVSPAIPVGFQVWGYRCGYSDVGAGRQHWDPVLNVPLEAPFDKNALIPEFDKHVNNFIAGNSQEFFHTKIKSPLDATGHSLHYVGPTFDLEDPAQAGNPSGSPVLPALTLGVQYPFNSDPHAVRLFIDLPGGISTGAIFDTVEVTLQNGLKFAHRWTTPVTKQSGWGIFCEHLLLF